jgi:hypothetical protein
MSKKQISDTATELINTLGRPVAHLLFPNDIDYYFVALELVDSKDRTVRYFAFPINPKNIYFNDTEATKVQRTFGGVTTIKTTTFDPKNYTIRGDFGRNFKVIVGGKPFSFSALNFDLDFKNLRVEFAELSVEVKSGYGATKILERIIKQAKELDQYGNPHRMYLYNTSLNHQYIVEPVDFNFDMNVQNNMIWNYNLRLNAIGEVKDFTGSANLLSSVSLGVINFAVNNLVSKLRQSLK